MLYSLIFHVIDLETWRCFARHLGPRSVVAMRCIRAGWLENGLDDALLVDPAVKPGSLWSINRGEDVDRLGNWRAMLD